MIDPEYPSRWCSLCGRWIEDECEHEEPQEEPHIDDTVHCCPECETPNQFGQLCYRCIEEGFAEA